MGEIDMSTAAQLRAALERMPGSRSTVDLRGVSYLEAAGVRVLCDHPGRDLRRPVAAGSAVHTVLGICGPGHAVTGHDVRTGAAGGRPRARVDR